VVKLCAEYDVPIFTTAPMTSSYLKAARGLQEDSTGQGALHLREFALEDFSYTGARLGG